MSSGGRRVVITQRNFDAEAIAYLRAQGCEPVIADDAPAGGGVRRWRSSARLSSASTRKSSA